MVSTRRTAHKEPLTDTTEPELGTGLRKKPVRKVTAKKTEPEPPKTSAPRGRKAAPKPPVRSNLADETTTDQPENPEQLKPTRRAGRPRKGTQSSATEELAATKPSKSAKTVSTRARKAGPIADEVPLLPAEGDSKPARRTRAAATRAQPLSPKKITQVSSSTTRDAKAPASKSKPVKRAPTTRTTKRRTVSDENADIHTPTSPTNNDNNEVVLATPSVKLVSPAKEQPEFTGSEDSMNSGPTTQSGSPVPDFVRMDDEHEYRHQGITSSMESDADEQEGSEESEDELCGPKTPMKRSSPGEEARYFTSVQRTTRCIEAQTSNKLSEQSPPLRRVNMANSQTQKRYSGSGIPLSETRPMAEARGIDKVLVFKDPVASPDINDDCPSLSTGGDRTFATENDIPERLTEIASPAPDNAVPRSRNNDELCKQREPEILNETIDDDAIGGNLSPSFGAQNSLESEDTILIAQQEDDALMYLINGDEYELASSTPVSPTPETLVWGNIKQDVTIPVNFDEYFANIQTATHTDAADRQCLAGDLTLRPAPELEDEPETAENDRFSAQENRALPETQGCADANTTVRLDEFIDIAALSEPTQAIQPPEELVEPGNGDTETKVYEEHKHSQHQSEDHYEGMVHNIDTEKDGEEPGPVLQESTNSTSPLNSRLQKSTQREVEESSSGNNVPHYALPTQSFDARRKSLPNLSIRTPINAGTRPHTSDGATMPRLANLATTPRWSSPRKYSNTPTRVMLSRHRPSMEDVIEGGKHTEQTIAETATATPCTTPKRLYHSLGLHMTSPEHAKTHMVPSRFRTPVHVSAKRPASVQKPPATTVTPRASSLRPRQTARRVNMSVVEAVTPAQPARASTGNTTPVMMQGERFPYLTSRTDYGDHAKTVTAPARFRTPTQAAPKRPETVQRHGSLRKVALKNTTPITSRTPMKTPLKPPAMTPGQVPMTPHPAAPLKGVVAMVEVFTLEGASASSPFIALLHRLGAKTTKNWSERVTHVIFKDGSPTTLQRVRVHNKEAEQDGNSLLIHCVNSRWVSDCESEGKRVNEKDEAYAVDIDEAARGGRRRRKSMEPAALVNVGGNIIRDRKSSAGYGSLGRTPTTFGSPTQKPEDTVQATPKAGPGEKENRAYEQSSPATPAYLAAPDTLIQQTAPLNRMRKLGVKAQDRAKNRRLTYFPSRA